MEKIYTSDWFSCNIPVWQYTFNHYNLIGKDDIKFLEIGCWEGRATNYLLENILTGNNTFIDVVDLFGDDLLERFNHNTQLYKNKIKTHIGLSSDILRELSFSRKNYYDFIYIDASHSAYGTLEDAVLSHTMLKSGGILIFDDYEWNPTGNLPKTECPKLGIDSFCSVYEDFYEKIFQGWQYGLVKK